MAGMIDGIFDVMTATIARPIENGFANFDEIVRTIEWIKIGTNEGKFAQSIDIQEGLKHYKKGEFEKAFLRFQKDEIVARNKNFFLTTQGILLAKNGKHAEAIAFFDRAIAQDPDDFDPLINRAASLAALDRWSDAEKDFELAHSLAGGTIALHVWSAILYKFKKNTEALEIIDRAIASSGDANKHQLFIERGVILTALGSLQDAIASYNDSLKIKVSSAAYKLIGRIIFEQNPQDALTYFAKPIHSKEGDSEANFLRGMTLLFRELQDTKPLNLKTARRCFENAIRLDEKNSDAYFLLGMTISLMDIDEPDKLAIKLMEKAISLNKNSGFYYWIYGLELSYADLPLEAVGALERAIELYPNKGPIYIALGDIFAKLFENDPIIDSREHGIEYYMSAVLSNEVIEGESLKSFKGLLLSAGRVDESIEIFRHLCEQNPSRHEIWLAFADILDKADRFEEAASAYTKVVELEPNDVYSWTRLGFMQSDVGKLPEAANAFSKACNLEPNNGFYWLALGYTLRDDLDLEGAIEAIQKAIICNPSDERANNALKSIQAQLKIIERRIAKTFNTRSQSYANPQTFYAGINGNYNIQYIDITFNPSLETQPLKSWGVEVDVLNSSKISGLVGQFRQFAPDLDAALLETNIRTALKATEAGLPLATSVAASSPIATPGGEIAEAKAETTAHAQIQSSLMPQPHALPAATPVPVPPSRKHVADMTLEELDRILERQDVLVSARPEIIENFWREVKLAKARANPKWVNRKKHPLLARLTAPEFLKTVHADIIENGIVNKEQIRAIDGPLMTAVEGYISQREGRDSGLGYAADLTFVASRPPTNKRKTVGSSNDI
jgi:tetratricopeptide (TPR) repeat protein